MGNNKIKYSIWFLTLILLQVLIVQNIHLGHYIILLPYILFIIILPYQTQKNSLLIISFFTGLIIDMFYDTAGIHAAACTLVGFSRPSIIKLLNSRGDKNLESSPSIKNMGILQFITYCFILIFIHHLVVFYLEIFRLNEFFTTLFRVFLSSVGTFGLIYTIQFLFNNSKV
ncbi:MAG: rod shape-determining protein MreD [Bacteroidota bacterium]